MKRVFFTTLMVVILAVGLFWMVSGWHFGEGAPMTASDYAMIVICVALATVIGGGLVTLLFIPAGDVPGGRPSEWPRQYVGTERKTRVARGEGSAFIASATRPRPRKRMPEADVLPGRRPEAGGPLSARG